MLMGLDYDTSPKATVVVCLVLQDAEGSVLVTQRPEHKRLGLLWEFPGGKVEFGEDPEVALRREIHEELCYKVVRVEALPVVVHSYDFGLIRLLPFLSVCKERPLFTLTEHITACWIDPLDWQSLEWAPADIPIIKNLSSQAHPV
jgi:8-oxo-dGTP diphosphatase